MKSILKTGFLALTVMALSFTACNEDDPITIDDSRYMQEDQMGRPAINTVFVSAGDKDGFNVTTPSKQGAAFAGKFNDQLLALNPAYSTNALGLDAATFTSVLATDVLTVSTQGKTTFFDGANVLTGRALADDVISVELLLIFGGPEGTGNPGLADDNVDANDKAFLNTFPYLATPH
ncbi:MAG: DUF4331 family protein [Lewinellaceae bacterium]|nr:DUF4331 family protein [Phaeodactylibacter sp.]MCB0614479.1 DUF4331 family protein [Phaeodactylibacter sp.]MCB9348290.1 DUF4331 family protein [Lewinellaceae bacterium]